jgi:hypothetical protein
MKSFQRTSFNALSAGVPFGKRMQRYGEFIFPPNILMTFLRKTSSLNELDILVSTQNTLLVAIELL